VATRTISVDLKAYKRLFSCSLSAFDQSQDETAFLILRRHSKRQETERVQEHYQLECQILQLLPRSLTHRAGRDGIPFFVY
jgi:hypothetical protein